MGYRRQIECSKTLGPTKRTVVDNRFRKVGYSIGKGAENSSKEK